MTSPAGSDGPFYEPWTDATRDYAPTPPPTSFTGPAGAVERVVLGIGRLIDRAQARFTPVAFGYAVFKKYADDEGSRLAALLAYYTFISLFPLVIGGFGVANVILRGRPDVVLEFVTRVVPPAYQAQVITAYEGLPDSGPAFVIAVVGLILAGTGGVFSFYGMVNQIFCVPYRFRYGFGPRYIRVLLMVALLGVGVTVVAVGSGIVGTIGDLAFIHRLAVFAWVWAVASSLLFAAPMVLARRDLASREVLLGSVLAGFTTTALISLGSSLVARTIATSSAVYGAFTTVIAIISLIFLVSNAIVFSYEISVVRAWQLWPRGVDINLLFPADERALALLTLMDERMPSQRNGIRFDAEGHFDPRRSSLTSLQVRAPGVPRTPYEVLRKRKRGGTTPVAGPGLVPVGPDVSGESVPPVPAAPVSPTPPVTPAPATPVEPGTTPATATDPPRTPPDETRPDAPDRPAAG